MDFSDFKGDNKTSLPIFRENFSILTEEEGGNGVLFEPNLSSFPKLEAVFFPDEDEQGFEGTEEILPFLDGGSSF